MEQELWFRLRRLQTHSHHLVYRPLLLSLLEGGPPGMDWGHFLDLARERGCPVEELESGAPEPAEISRFESRRLLAQGFHLLTPSHPDYPESFRRSIDPPLTLTVRGNLQTLSLPGLAVVGTREPTMDSLHWMESELGAFCREQRVPIFSGGARGIDQKAHSVALRHGSATVVFLPSGIENAYPADIVKWFKPILEGGGAIVSEYPAREVMRKAHFHQRNRLIAAAGVATLVVEAKIRSGTLITAMRAAEIGRPLLALPGHPLNPHFGGNLQLLAEGATMVRQSEDLTLFWQAEKMTLEGIP